MANNSDVLSGDCFDIRNVIERFEEIESEYSEESVSEEQKEELEYEEFQLIKAFLDEIKGNGGDEQWRGDWYPVTFIRDSYFEDYAREFAEDIYGKEIADSKWPFDCIDWAKAAEDLKDDYASVKVGDDVYWYR